MLCGVPVFIERLLKMFAMQLLFLRLALSLFLVRDLIYSRKQKKVIESPVS